MEQRSTIATVSAWIGVLAMADVVLGPLLIHLGVASPLGGFYIFALGLVPGMLAALVTGAIGLARTREGSGLAGRERAWLGLGCGVALAAVLVASVAPGGGGPAIHDITTDIDDPPAFSERVAGKAGRVNGVVYPDGGPDVPELQREAYPDLAPIRVPMSPAGAFEHSLHSAQILGWTVSHQDPKGGTFEAFEMTPVFQFVDDIVVRVRPDGGHSIVDLRSNSRVGRGDIGANAARIRAFRDLLLSMEE